MATVPAALLDRIEDAAGRRRVLLLADGPNRGALPAARALARAGWTVGCASSRRATSLAAASRATRYWHRTPAPDGDLEGFLKAIETAEAEVGYDAVLPASDCEALAVSWGRHRLRAFVPLPPHDDVVRAFDKLHLAEGASRAGLTPALTLPASEEALAIVGLPAVVKSRLHWRPGTAADRPLWRTRICATADEVRARVAEIRAGGGEPLLQARLSGHLLICHAVLDRDGRLLTCVQQLSDPPGPTLLTWPPGVGTRVRSRTVAGDAVLAARVGRFFADLGWYGFASLQFIVPRDGVPRVVDFNGRIPASFALSIAACPDLVPAWMDVVMGGEPHPLRPPGVGVRFQWVEGDVRRALAERRGGLVGDLMSCLTYAVGAVHGIWSVTDPGPALGNWRRHLHDVWRRLWRRGPARATPAAADGGGS